MVGSFSLKIEWAVAAACAACAVMVGMTGAPGEPANEAPGLDLPDVADTSSLGFLRGTGVNACASSNHRR